MIHQRARAKGKSCEATAYTRLPEPLCFTWELRVIPSNSKVEKDHKVWLAGPPVLLGGQTEPIKGTGPGENPEAVSGRTWNLNPGVRTPALVLSAVHTTSSCRFSSLLSEGRAMVSGPLPPHWSEEVRIQRRFQSEGASESPN